MNSVPSGLHRYAGSSAHTNLRIVLTHPKVISEKWASKTTTANDKYQMNKSTSIKQTNLNVQYQASYLVTKSLDTGKWVVKDEEANNGIAGGGADPASKLEPIIGKDRAGADDGNKCLSAKLRREGFVLNLVSVPSGSRMKCHVCKQEFCATIIDKFNRKSGIRLFNEDKQRNERTNGVHADGLVSSSANGGENTDNIRNLHQHNASRDFSNLFAERRRASSWKDTLNKTSDTLSNAYWAKVDARKLTTGRCDSTEGRSARSTTTRTNPSASPLLRNHYFPSYEPCQCSLIESARTDKTLDDFCAGPLICAPCLIDNGSASDNNENRNSLDRREDNLEIPMSEILRCRCHTGNSRSPQLATCHCRCAELSEAYKRCQKLLNRMPEGSATNTMGNPLNDNLMFISQLIGTKSDDVEAKALNRKLAKLIEFNAIDDSLDGNSYDALGALLFDLDLPRETNEARRLEDEADFLFKVNKALGNSQAADGSMDSRSASASANLCIRRRLDHVNDDGGGIDSGRRTKLEEATDRVCHCTGSHGQTLLVLLEKYQSSPLMGECPDEKTTKAISNHEPKGKPYSGTNDENGATSRESHDANLEQMNQSRDPREITPSEPNLIAISAEQSLGMLDSVPTASAVATSADDNGANANKIDHVEQTNERDPQQSMEDSNQAHSSARTNPRDNKDDVNPKACPELPLSARALNGSVDDHDNQREYSIALAVVVIDAFNGTIQLKPDLNELVLLDMSALNERTNEATPDTTVIESLRINADDRNTGRADRRTQILYHIEAPDCDEEFLASEQDLALLREAYGLSKLIHDQIDLESAYQKQTRQIFGRNELSSSLNMEDFLLKLQLDIHYACGFAIDCKNLYIKYKIYSREDESWHIKRLIEAPTTRGGHKELRDGSLIQANSLTASKQVGKDKTKLEHMTHIWTPQDSGIDDTNFIATDITAAASDKWLFLDSDTNQASVMESCWRDSDCDNDSHEDNEDEGYDDDRYSLLLEGSTVTSRSDSRGHFNFCCVEQLVLGLTGKSKQTLGDNQRNFSASRVTQDDTKIRLEESKGQGKIAAEIDERKRTKSNDRNQMQTSTGVVHSSPPDRMISESLERSTSANGEQISSTVITSENCGTKIEINHETDNIIPSDKIDIEQSRGVISNNNNESSNSNDLSRDRASNEPPTSKSQGVTDGLRDDNLRSNLNGACQIIIVFEIYSSDFFSDKLKGWSSMKVPISLELDNFNATSMYHQPVDRCCAELTQISHERIECRRTHLEPRHCLLPVMRPALGAPMDRLRYYLLGEIPMKTPTTTSVSMIPHDMKPDEVFELSVLAPFSHFD